MAFIGREQELMILDRFLKKETASFLVVRGRRRIGKSRLIEEFAKPYKLYSFSGIAPTDKTTDESQREEFASQLHKQGLPKIQAENWNDLFWALADVTKKGRVIILLDEISWMGSKDPDFLGKLKNVWDQYLKKNPKLILVVCGSASSWIEKNILTSTGFLGHISYTLTLDQLPLKDCQKFWGKKNQNISAAEKLKVLAVTGGVPRYLEELDPDLSAEDNIKNMCFTKGALLADEFNNIFSNIFLTNSDTYKKIVQILSEGEKEYSKICRLLNIEDSGRISDYLEELKLSGFITRDYTWHVKTGKDSKLSKFRLSDNYLRFFLKYIEKYKTKIERNAFSFKSLVALPGWPSIIALQFENLVLNNRRFIWNQLGIKPEDILSENPFFQRSSKRQPGCQIDYLIQTKHDSLYLCEIKFQKGKVSSSVIAEMQEKVDRLKKPKGLSCRPVLIHVNGVEDDVEESEYFSSIIDFGNVFD